MKHLLLTTIAAALMAWCATLAQQSPPPTESKPVELVTETAPTPPDASKRDAWIKYRRLDSITK